MVKTPLGHLRKSYANVASSLCPKNSFLVGEMIKHPWIQKFFRSSVPFLYEGFLLFLGCHCRPRKQQVPNQKTTWPSIKKNNRFSLTKLWLSGETKKPLGLRGKKQIVSLRSKILTHRCKKPSRLSCRGSPATCESLEELFCLSEIVEGFFSQGSRSLRSLDPLWWEQHWLFWWIERIIFWHFSVGWCWMSVCPSSGMRHGCGFCGICPILLLQKPFTNPKHDPKIPTESIGQSSVRPMPRLDSKMSLPINQELSKALVLMLSHQSPQDGAKMWEISTSQRMLRNATNYM